MLHLARDLAAESSGGDLRGRVEGVDDVSVHLAGDVALEPADGVLAQGSSLGVILAGALITDEPELAAEPSSPLAR
jgi:hypothetical protein